VPDAIIDAIRTHADGDIVSVLPPAFRKGQRLQVTDGPFADVEGLFECIDDNQRVVLLLDFMGRAVKTSVPGHAVTAA